MKWDILHNSLLYKGFFNINHLRVAHSSFHHDTKMVIERELIQRGDAVAVLPYDPVNDTVLLVEQFRIGALESDHSPWMLEIIAGIVEPGEEYKEVAHREAQEEAGCNLLELLPIHHYYATPGSSSERISVFLARATLNPNQDQSIHGLAHEGEEIRVHIMPVTDAIKLLECARIESAMSIIALQWLHIHHASLRRRWLDNA